jgi:S1-C subfamily serine protease
MTLRSASKTAARLRERDAVSDRRELFPSFFDARLIGSDSVLDLALLKIPATGLKPISFGNATDVRQGQVVLAAGNPLGMENSISLGVVSSSSRQLSEDDPRVFIQRDASINPGTNGGPLVDIDGRLVGINTFIISESGGSEGVGVRYLAMWSLTPLCFRVSVVANPSILRTYS